MSTKLTPIDISNMPDLLDLVEEVEETKKPRELKLDDKVVAVLSPVLTRGKNSPKPTNVDYQKSLAAIGSWSDLDPDELIANIHRWREEGSRPASRP
jgi:hypothetical protein